MKKYENKSYESKEITYLNFIWALVISTGIALLMVWPSSASDILKVLPQRWFYIPFLGIICTNMVFILIVDWTTIILDKRYRWEDGFTKRSVLQLLLGWFFPLVLSVIFCRLYFGFLQIDILLLLYSRHLLPMVLITSLLVSVGYAGYYLSCLFRKYLVNTMDVGTGLQYSDHLIFSDAGGELKIQVDDIAYLCSHGKMLSLQLHLGEPVILGLASLKEIAAKLDPYHFLMVNRSYIIARATYRGYKKHGRGFLLILEPQPREQVKVSEANKEIVLEWVNDQR